MENLKEILQTLGNELVDRIIFITKEKNIKLTSFYSEIGVTKQAVSKWRQGSLPSCSVLAIMAKNLGVSSKWLLMGGNSSSNSEVQNQKKIIDRIDERIYLYTNKKANDKNFYDILDGVVSRWEIQNWREGRAKINIEKIPLIADRLEVNVQYLLTGSNISKEEYANQYSNEYSYSNILYKKLYCLNEKHTKIVKRAISLCLRSQEVK